MENSAPGNFRNFFVSGLSRPLAVVIGGGGFVGSFLCEALLMQGCRVFCIDNFSSGDKSNLTGCIDNPDFCLFKHDIYSPVAAGNGDHFVISRADYIFYLAGNENNDEKTEQLKINNILSVGEKTGAKILIVVDSDYQEAIVAGSFVNNGINIRAVRIGDVYGPRMNLSSPSSFSRILRSVVNEGSIYLKNIPPFLHPTFISDVIYGLIKAMFAPGTSGEIISLIDRNEINKIDLARLLKQLYPGDLMIVEDGEGEFSGNEITRSLNGKLPKFNWAARVGIQEGLMQTISFFQSEINKAKSEDNRMASLSRLLRRENFREAELKTPMKDKDNFVKHKRAGGVKNKRRFGQGIKKILSAIIVLVFISILPFVFLVGQIFIGYLYINHAQNLAIEGKIDKGLSAVKNASYFLASSSKTIKALSPYYRIFLGSDLIDTADKLIDACNQIGAGVNYVGDSFSSVEKMFAVVFKKEAGSIGDISQKIKSNLDLAYDNFGKAESVFGGNEGMPSRIFFIDTKIFVEGLSKLPYMRKLILEARNAAQALPTILGVYKKQVYLVLLQNNSELRPTGGFIGSFALLTFDGGRFVDFEVKDVYAADGQLKGHVEPPSDLKKYLGEANWFLRDSNWDPDFPTSAIRANWFLGKEMNRSVDGVIGVNLNVARGLLAAAGEIRLSDFNETINAENLFERAEYHAEVNFFPGSTQKQDFLGSLSRALFEKIKNSNREEQYKIIREVYQSLMSKDIQIHLSNKQLFEIMNSLSWSGGQKKVSCEWDRCLQDYLMIVESNVGINKANYFSKRQIEQEISINEIGEVWRRVAIEYRNTSQSDIFPGGIYKNYLRFYVLARSQPIKVLIEGEDRTLESESYESRGFQVFGVIVNVPVAGKQTVEIIYKLNDKVDLSAGDFRYILGFQKQSGIKDEMVISKFTVPEMWRIQSVKPEKRESKGNTLMIGMPLDSDKLLDFQLTRK